jgi:CheY-like chemotaxis protein
MSVPSDKPLLGARVLVVDDDLDSREIYALVLEEAGATVRVDSGSTDGLSSALEWQPTLVISDLVMPAGDGFTFVQKLHATRGLEHVPVIAVSGLVSAKAREDALAAGFRDYLGKPVMPDDLIALVARWTSKPADGGST